MRWMRIASLLLFLGAILIGLRSENSLTGRATARLVVVDIYSLSCNLTLRSGWNLISIPCFDNGPGVAAGLRWLEANRTVIDNGTPTTALVYSYRSVHTYDAADPDDPWKAFAPGLPSYVVIDLLNLSSLSGYFVYLHNSSFFSYESRISMPNYVVLHDGYNLIGYPSNNTVRAMPVEQAFGTINRSVLALYRLSPGWQSWTHTVQEFQNLTPFEGYWLVSSANTTWVVER